MISNLLLLGEVAKNVDMVDNVFWGVTWVCIFSLVGITVAMLYFMGRYRRRGDEIGADIHGSTALEITWTVIPTIIVMIMFWYGWKGFEDLRAQPKGALQIHVVGGQWNWNYTYKAMEKDSKGDKKEVMWKVSDSSQEIASGYVGSATLKGIVSIDLRVSRFKSEMPEKEWGNLLPLRMTKEEWAALNKEDQEKARGKEQKRIINLTPPKGYVNAFTKTRVESARTVVFTTGPNRGQERLITSYDRKTGSLSWEEDLPKPCSNGDSFEVKGRLIRSVLYAPINTPVILKIGSVDVLHSYYIPAFRTKEDAVPGLDTRLFFEAKEVGVYEVLCAEYCGAPPEPDAVVGQWLGHHNMKSTVQIVSKEAYAKWEAHKGALPMATILEEETASLNMGHPGFAVLEKNQCLSCHRVDGSEEYAPSFLGMFGKTQTVISAGEKREVEVDADYIRKSIEDPSADIVEEYEGRRTKMLPLEISEEELAMVVRYLKGLK
ncbi:MAG: cytochrome c oxidase subunit II [Planctomycetota bacterium]|nr:cytochrome c oxidase subunit II [Planctomycetota bacterium]